MCDAAANGLASQRNARLLRVPLNLYRYRHSKPNPSVLQESIAPMQVFS
jgi:hypothetical protein